MSKDSNTETNNQALTKPLILIIIGVGIALALALILSNEGPESQINPVISPNKKDVPITAEWRGNEEAALKLLEFGDYQCPGCKAYHEIVQELFNRYPSEIRLEFRHFPLIGIHANALLASTAAEAAREQDHFWEMHDLLFQNQTTWSQSGNPEALFMSYATLLDLNEDQFMRSMRDIEVESRVLEDVTRGRELGIASVPSFFVDGLPIDLPPNIEAFEVLLRQALSKTQ